VLIETWDRSSRAARLFGDRWHEWSPPSVVQWFTTDELSRWAIELGWRELDRGRYPKWISLEHGLSLAGVSLPGVSHSGVSHSGRLGRAARRIALPYPGDDLVWIIFRTS
jgi:hypothetical protein